MYNANVIFKDPMTEMKALAMLHALNVKVKPSRHFWVITGMTYEQYSIIYDMAARFIAW